MDTQESLIKDIVDSLPDFELMERYKLSAADLRRRLIDLIIDGTVDSSHIFWRPVLYDYELADSERRLSPRYPLKLLIPITISGSSVAASGLLVDISEKGGRVLGIDPPLGERVSLKIDTTAFGLDEKIEMETVFRWSQSSGGAEFMSGFEILSISEQDLQFLRNLVREVIRR